MKLADQTIEEVYPDREQWLAGRRNGIGGSDAQILLGQVAGRGPADLWLDKVDGSEKSTTTERMKWGIRQEHGIRTGYAEDSGRDVIAPESPFTIVRNGAIPWLSFSPDGFQYAKDDFDGPGIIQVKNVASDQRWKWEDGVPEQYVVQVQHEMMVGGWQWSTVVALFGGNECDWWDLEANETFQKSLLAVEADFWDHVQRQVCPPVDPELRSALATLKRLYSESEHATISLSGSRWTAALDRIQAAKLAIKEEQEEIDRLTAAIQAEMKTAEAAILEDGRQVTWKSQKHKEYTVPAGSFRVFRVPNSKGDKT